jgi:hypothetical protein
MGFLSNEVNKLTFKVQAGNVIDASSGKQWYESVFPYNPSLLANRVLTQFEQVKQYPAANLSEAQSAANNIPSIIEDISTSSIRLSQAVPGENNTWVAYATYSTPSSGILDLWIQPQKVPQASGVPSAGYGINLYSGDPDNGGVLISTTIGQSGGEVGWVFNYDMGLLFLANDLVTLIQNNGSTYPAGLDFYIRGFRYIGETLANSGGSGTIVNFEDSDTIAFTQSGDTYSAFIRPDSITVSNLKTVEGGATAGYLLSNDGLGNFQWVDPSTTEASITVADYLTGQTFSGIQNIIFRGGAVNVPVAGPTATGVNVTNGQPNTVTVWIPAPNYVGYFSPTLGTGTQRYISQPTNSTYTSSVSAGTFGIGDWDITNNFSQDQTRTTINSSGNFTAFNSSNFACFNTGTTMSFTLYNHDGSVLSSIDNYVINGVGSTSSNGISITVNSFLPDSDRYKASVSGQINIGSLFPNGGRFSWNIVHYNGEGPGNTTTGVYSFTRESLFYDNDGSVSSANIADGVDFDELSAQTVQYSGVYFYKTGTTFALTASNINLLNDITFPTTEQIDFTCHSMAISGSLNGYADGSKAVGTAITGWTIDWNNSGLTFSRTATVNSTGLYIPGFSTNNTISSNPAASFVRSTIYDWNTVGFSQSVSRAMLFDTYTPTNVTLIYNPIDSENGRLSVSGVMSNGDAAYNSSLSLSNTNTDELQYIFGRVIYPQTNFTQFYPTVNWGANVDYSSLSGSNKTFTVFTDINTGATTNLNFLEYRWHVTKYGKSSSFSNGVFTFNSNFSESFLDYDGVNSTSGSGDLVILVGIDSSSNNSKPDKFLFVSGNPVTYKTRQNPIDHNLNKGASSKDIQWSKGTLSASVNRIWLFIGYKDSVIGKNLNMMNIGFD